MNRAVAAVIAIVLVSVGLWWGLDGTPPELDVLPSWGEQPVAGEVELRLVASDGRTGLAAVTVEIDGAPVPVDGEVARIDGAALADGSHQVIARARDRRGNTEARELVLRTDNHAPDLAIAPIAAARGRTAVIWVQTDEPLVDAWVTLLGGRFALRPVGEGWARALVGVAAGLEEASATVGVTAADAAGNRAELSQAVDIEQTDFPRGGMIDLTAAQVAARRDSDAIDAANEARREAYARPVDGDLWRGTFDLPCEGIVSSPFGKVRTYSDGKISRHLGTDMAAPKGTPVRSPAAGVVVLSQPMAIYGEVIIVKHGPEVATSYNHLSQRDVAVGDAVARGDVIGLVGSTGQSTGPHLHWGMTVGGVAVAPEQWTEQAFDAPPETGE